MTAWQGALAERAAPHLERRATRDVRIVAGRHFEEAVHAGVAVHRHGAHPVPLAVLLGRVDLQPLAGPQPVDEDVRVDHSVGGDVEFAQPLRGRDLRVGVQPGERIRQRSVERGGGGSGADCRRERSQSFHVHCLFSILQAQRARYRCFQKRRQPIARNRASGSMAATTGGSTPQRESAMQRIVRP